MRIDIVRFCSPCRCRIAVMNAFLPLLVLVAVAATNASDDTFAQEMVDIHNQYRILHGVANLTLDSDLSAYAQAWADHLSANGLLDYRDNDDGYGENVFLSPEVATAAEVCADWYDEGDDYADFTAEPDMSTFDDGEFTQMVWKSTEKLGCGKATNSSGADYVVCNYYPEGNYIGMFVENVNAPSSS